MTYIMGWLLLRVAQSSLDQEHKVSTEQYWHYKESSFRIDKLWTMSVTYTKLFRSRKQKYYPGKGNLERGKTDDETTQMNHSSSCENDKSACTLRRKASLVWGGGLREMPWHSGGRGGCRLLPITWISHPTKPRRNTCWWVQHTFHAMMLNL